MSLHHNGAANPDRWAPSHWNTRPLYRAVRGGELVAWRYAAWRILEVTTRDAVDGGGLGVVLRHERGPVLTDHTQLLHDGSVTVHVGAKVTTIWNLLSEPYAVCSCHGDPMPCQEMDQTAYAAASAERMDRMMATTQPGVCGACLEPISTRQRVVTFPEPSRWVPGAPGPTFHAGRTRCWAEAEKYERAGRLADDPGVVRLASCPGIRFIHEARDLPVDRRLECTAGLDCTGHHGPPGYRHDRPCWDVIHFASNREAFAHPDTDCGYRSGTDRACLGSHVTGGGAANEMAGDLLWEARQRSSGGWAG